MEDENDLVDSVNHALSKFICSDRRLSFLVLSGSLEDRTYFGKDNLHLSIQGGDKFVTCMNQFIVQKM